MLWHDAEDAIRAHIEAAWPATDYAAMPLVFENETPPDSGAYLAINVEGTYADKSIYGSAGKRLSIEAGLVFIHAFVAQGEGKRAATGPVVAMTSILELQVISTGIQMDGGNPPTPVADADELAPNPQPGGQFYRCSGSVPFLILGAR